MAAKAAALSGLVFPGMGQLYLGNHLRGWVLILVAATGLYFLLAAATSVVWDLANAIELGARDLAMDTFAVMLKQSMTAFNSAELKVAQWTVLGSWLVAVTDAYRVGKQRDEATSKG